MKTNNNIPAVLIEINKKGYFQRYALTPEEFRETFGERLEKGMPKSHTEWQTYELRPMVHMWYRDAAVGDGLWNTFFSDMEYGLSEGDIKSGNLAYIEHSEMKSLSPYVPVEIDNDAPVYYTVQAAVSGPIGEDTYTHFVQRYKTKDSGIDLPGELVYIGEPKMAYTVADHLNAKESAYGRLLAENISLRNEQDMDILTGDAAEYNALLAETKFLKDYDAFIQSYESGPLDYNPLLDNKDIGYPILTHNLADRLNVKSTAKEAQTGKSVYLWTWIAH